MNCNNLPSKEIWHIDIPMYDAAEHGLRLSSILKLQQEVGERHMRRACLGFDGLAEKNMTFVLSQANSRILLPLTYGEKAAIVSWHHQSRGVRFYRCYQFWREKQTGDFEAGRGELAVESISSFALLDMGTHKVLRPAVFEQFGVVGNEESCGCPFPEKFSVPPTMKPAGTWEPRWSHTDGNRHVNNAVYADLLCDFIEGGMAGRRLTGFSIRFLGEALAGDTVMITHGREKTETLKSFYVTGTHERGRCFESVCYENE